MRRASRVVRLTAPVAAGLSVGWLLLRRRTRPAATAPAESHVPEPRTEARIETRTEPRAPEPVSSIGRPVRDTGDGAPAPAAVAVEERPADDAGNGASAAAPAAADEPLGHDAGTGAPAPAAVTAEERTDDLRRIKGVGPAIESALRAAGVRSYRQLATLDQAGLDRVRDAVKERWQRLEREDWIGQARKLHREKYGEEV